MQKQIREYIASANRSKRISNSLWQVVICLSLVVSLGVFWYLKLTGITLAGDAFCGKAEHTHSEECQIKELICTLSEDDTHSHTDECFKISKECSMEEHIHEESCYSDITADLETEDDWEMSLAGISRGTSTAENVILVARSQLGYTESVLNFEVDDGGVRRGITRYGQWYGNPYGGWSAMFASFCLSYAGVEDVPINGGADAMRLEWMDAGIYKNADEYSAKPGDLLFLRKNTADESETASASDAIYADTVAIITAVEDNTITVIEGDLNDSVEETVYTADDPSIIGYGTVPEVSDFAVLAEPFDATTPFARVTDFSTNLITSTNQFVFYYTVGNESYAIDGSGNAVRVRIGDDGMIYTDTDDPSTLLWTISRYNNSSYAIQNVGSGRYLHPFYNGASDNGITTPGRWGTTITVSNGSVSFSHSAFIAYNSQTGNFEMTRNRAQNVTFNVGITQPCTVWFDGTNGGIMSLGGSDNRSYTVYTDSVLTLPSEWKSPDKYSYTLKGWYDIVNHRYYAPGEKAVITGNTVFYADWKSSSYDVGQFNAHVTDTVSTNNFVTVNMFDYGVLFNLLSESVNVSVDSSGHSETWNLITSGKNPYNGNETLDFIFRDWDRGNEDISYPSGHNDKNNPTEAGSVYPGLYTDELRDLLFDPETKVIGKEHLGIGDHLFQLCLDPTHDHYGYYYYNSEHNAASYNQTDQRFYVYDYLECTRDSLNSEEGKYSDFLPLNSPYTNTNGKQVNTYSYEGVEGEYVGTTHYMYDSRYNDNNNSPDYVGTNYWFGMSVSVDFYLPNTPGTIVDGDGYGNQDVYGKDMHFRFTGDDDVWIFIDGEMVLDLGGLHGRESGDINFSLGEVTVNGVRNEEFSNVLKSLSSGEHVLTLYYLERGSSLSNCAIYFNLAPRFDFSIRKEDVLTRDVLNGAEFSVFTDEACTVPAELWVSKESHDRKDPSTNVFTVIDGVANMWGMGAGNKYYIKETKPPDDPNYGFSNGVICLSFDKDGTASYNVTIIDGGDGISPGFIVHGFRIDAETQQAYIVATNAPEWVEETTSVQVLKKWNDSLDHSGQSITVYLTVKDPDGTVRRLQEAVLSSDNRWTARWDNLPKYAEDGVTLIQYGVEETYVSGYYSVVESATGQFEIVTSEWRDTTSFENGKVYIIKDQSGQALSTLRSAEDTGYMWISAESAKTSPLALWTASVSGNNVRLTNAAGQTITFYYGNGRPTDFFAYEGHVEDNNRKQYLRFTAQDGGFVLGYSNYYLASTLNSSSKFENTTQQSRALIIIPCTKVDTVSSLPIDENGYIISNTPLEKETSLTVHKNWVIPDDMNESIYEKAQVTVKLYANGTDTGRTVTLSLRNGWTASFKGLPYTDAEGNIISYTVKEEWITDDWITSYSDIAVSGGTVPTYSVTVTNSYRTGGPILPSTGSPARMIYILCGVTIMLVPLIYGSYLRRKRERRHG
ncbi:MAG: Cna B-type domain-containing protein [Ruminococcaceae bacterium]|nr:Cna B-type domain-containing protein [Oscillospiraceae bacterium]